MNGGHILKLKAICGKNQRGFSFVAPQGESFTDPVQLVLGTKTILTRIRESPKVPQDLIIIDKRLYQSLRAEAGTEVEIVSLDFEIPYCDEMTLVVSAKRDVDVKEVVRALSDRIEDMESHLDGLLLTEGQKLDLDSLGISITVNDLSPRSEKLGAALVDWRKVLKVYLEANLGSHCFNVSLVTDLGAASRKSDIALSGSEVEVAGDGVVRRFEAADHLSRSLLETLSFCDGTSFFSSVVFSEEVDIFTSSDDSDTNSEITRIRSRNIAQTHSDWISGLLEKHDGKASDPSSGLKMGIELAEQLQSANNKPTVLIFMSSGTYSHGRNPVATARKLLKGKDKISIICVGLGKRCEESILSGIAEAVQGTVVIINGVGDIPVVKDMIINQTSKDVY